MEPGQLLVALLYLWLAIALGVYLWRAYRRVAHGETRADRVARRRELEGDGDRPVSSGGTGTDGTSAAAVPIGTAIPARPTVAELVEGIALPCDLLPVPADHLDPHSVAFATTGHAAAEVSDALVGELERLGFAVSPETETDAVARRGDAILRVTVRADAGRGAPAGGDPTRVVAELSS